jgi:hypothetical protein
MITSSIPPMISGKKARSTMFVLPFFVRLLGRPDFRFGHVVAFEGTCFR